jgi:hypothetical protein
VIFIQKPKQKVKGVFKFFLKVKKNHNFATKIFIFMETMLVLPKNLEQKRTIEAFLKALKIQYLPVKPTLEELEARLTPKQKLIWSNLQAGLVWVDAYKNGQIPAEEIKTLDNLLNEYENAIHSN